MKVFSPSPSLLETKTDQGARVLADLFDRLKQQCQNKESRDERHVRLSFHGSGIVKDYFEMLACLCSDPSDWAFYRNFPQENPSIFVETSLFSPFALASQDIRMRVLRDRSHRRVDLFRGNMDNFDLVHEKLCQLIDSLELSSKSRMEFTSSASDIAFVTETDVVAGKKNIAKLSRTCKLVFLLFFGKERLHIPFVNVIYTTVHDRKYFSILNPFVLAFIAAIVFSLAGCDLQELIWEIKSIAYPKMQLNKETEKHVRILSQFGIDTKSARKFAAELECSFTEPVDLFLSFCRSQISKHDCTNFDKVLECLKIEFDSDFLKDMYFFPLSVWEVIFLWIRYIEHGSGHDSFEYVREEGEQNVSFHTLTKLKSRNEADSNNDDSDEDDDHKFTFHRLSDCERSELFFLEKIEKLKESVLGNQKVFFHSCFASDFEDVIENRKVMLKSCMYATDFATQPERVFYLNVSPNAAHNWAQVKASAGNGAIIMIFVLEGDFYDRGPGRTMIYADNEKSQAWKDHIYECRCEKALRMQPSKAYRFDSVKGPMLANPGDVHNNQKRKTPKKEDQKRYKIKEDWPQICLRSLEFEQILTDGLFSVLYYSPKKK